MDLQLVEVQDHKNPQEIIKILYLKINLSGSNEKDTEQKDKKQFSLKEEGVLTNNENINWDIIKNEVENMYASIPTITIDLYQLNINKEDILGFNSRYDNLTKAVKEEDKEKTLKELVKVYEYLPRFLINQDELYKTIVETKLEVLKGYSKLGNGDWKEIENDLDESINKYSKLLANSNIESKKQYSINKCFIMLNELKNTVYIKDETVFLIKYKNLLEELDNI